MSFRNHKNLVVVVGVIIALLAGTVLLGGYAKFAPAKQEVSSPVQVKGCCPMMGAQSAQDGKASSANMAKAAFNAETCPAGRTEPCCEEDPPQDCCGKPCPADCPKPCCAAEGAASDCANSTSGCCPVAADSATK